MVIFSTRSYVNLWVLFYLFLEIRCSGVILRPELGENRHFIPVNYQWQVLKAQQLDVQVYSSSVKGEQFKVLTKPKKIKNIKGDGNCFFNAISYWITGAQHDGGLMRLLIVYSMKMSERFQTMLSEWERNLRVQEMLKYTTYAECHELFAAAEFLQTSLYVYSEDAWHFISKNGIGSEEILEPCIYMHHVNNNHYEVILDVDDEPRIIEKQQPPIKVVEESKVQIFTENDAETAKYFQYLYDLERDNCTDSNKLKAFKKLIKKSINKAKNKIHRQYNEYTENQEIENLQEELFITPPVSTKNDTEVFQDIKPPVSTKKDTEVVQKDQNETDEIIQDISKTVENTKNGNSLEDDARYARYLQDVYDNETQPVPRETEIIDTPKVTTEDANYARYLQDLYDEENVTLSSSNKTNIAEKPNAEKSTVDDASVAEIPTNIGKSYENYMPVTVEEVMDHNYVIEVTTDPMVNTRHFVPVTLQWQARKCMQFGLKLKKSVFNHDEPVKLLGNPTDRNAMPKNNNSLYHAISYWITGSSDYAKFLRKRINSKKDITDEYFEFFEIAQFLNTSIYLHSFGVWQFFSKDGINAVETVQSCLYLSSVDKVHFEVVTNVE
ncbi:uncharacterized protein LOC126896148 isoform X2 [Daktulosphaira vitifoliae]|uniref:uncharacterized protein LOC126896148 isoform X2 n=1 Tax=Daktulosphaira vitifoliae TaxID=58002 RepID=UPI0021AA871D|nr:uncharacterized protein LOC126896148 isoform X2 [Daktulosphaira vitifoliae]